LYYGGPYFESATADFDVIATWKDHNGYPSIINFNFEKGKVLLIGPHLEIEENSNRDSTNFADELDDVESDWDFLKTIVKWALPQVSDITTRDIIISNSNIYPNPAYNYILVDYSAIDTESKIVIFNVYGEKMSALSAFHSETHQEGKLRIDITHLPLGLYILKNGNKTEKFMVVR
jgi:hypothetical protein